MDTQEYRPIYDIKLAKVLNRQLILAITDTSLHQFVSQDSANIKKTFNDYKANDNKLMKEHSLRLDASRTHLNNEDEGEDIIYNQLKLYTNQQTN